MRFDYRKIAPRTPHGIECTAQQFLGCGIEQCRVLRTVVLVTCGGNNPTGITEAANWRVAVEVAVGVMFGVLAGVVLGMPTRLSVGLALAGSPSMRVAVLTLMFIAMPQGRVFLTKETAVAHTQQVLLVSKGGGTLAKRLRADTLAVFEQGFRVDNQLPLAAEVLRQNLDCHAFRVTQAENLFLRPAHDEMLAFANIGVRCAVIAGLKKPVQLVPGFNLIPLYRDGEPVTLLGAVNRDRL